MSYSKRALMAASSLILTVAAPAFAQEALGPEVEFTQNFSTLAPTAGNDTVNVAEDTALYLPPEGNFIFPRQEQATIDFLGGTNVVNNDGYVFVGTERGQVYYENPGRTGVDFIPYLVNVKNYEALMRMENLTVFNNDGAIYMGSVYETAVDDALLGTDRWHDDILSMPGADFVGGENSRIFLDVDFNSTAPQTACNAAQRSTEPVGEGDTGGGTLPVADCIDLTGGAASGRTEVIIHDVNFGDLGAYNPAGAVIVDLAGGDPEAINPDAFVIGGVDTQGGDIQGYDPRNGGGVDKGLFLYTLGYDSEAQQFKLYGVQGAAARQLPLLAHAASDLWRTASGGWFERQTDQRDLDPGRGGGVWGRIVSSKADRGVVDFGQAGDKVLVFDNSYQQEDDAVTFGVDLVSSDGAGGSWLLGAMVGYGRSRVDFNDYDNTANLEGMHGGIYGGVTAGALFVDAAINGTWLDVNNDVPVMGLLPAGTTLGTKVNSLGGRLEAGWRFQRDRLVVEPLAGVTYVRTSFEDLSIPADDPARLGGDVTFDDATSTRASAGARFSIEDVLPLTPTNRISLTARHGVEFDGEASASIANIGPDAALVSDSFDGQFSELSATLTAGNAAETVAGYVNFGALFGDDYDKLAVSAGLRFQW